MSTPGRGATLTTKAVQRALDDRHREASEEVERILAATVRVMERVTPEAPRVSDIVAEAGSSKKAFYRYFAGKDDLLLAVLERGVAIIVSYLEHQMAKADGPQDKIACWISGALAQIAEPQLIAMSRAVVGQLPTVTGSAADDIMGPMRDLLIEPVSALPGTDPRRDADAVFALTAAAMRRHVGAAAAPHPDDIDHLVRFCLRGLHDRTDGTP
jgi:AcrR family transcriptional regulator